MEKTNLMDNEFYLANYGTDENIEIFKNYYHAKKESIDGNVYRCNLNKELVFFEQDIKEWNYEDKSDLFLDEPKLCSDIEITKDNIHLFYEFMSDEDKQNIKNKYIISDALCTRFYAICDIVFKDEKPENINKYVVDIMNRDLQKEQIIFGIKDTLKPINEYIAEIKASKEYQEYKQPQKNETSFLQTIKDTPALKEQVIQDINDWHSACEQGVCGDCEVYDALQDGTISEDKLIDIAFDVDPDLFDKYTDESLSKSEGSFNSILINENMDVEKEKADLAQRVDQDSLSQDYN